MKLDERFDKQIICTMFGTDLGLEAKITLSTCIHRLAKNRQHGIGIAHFNGSKSFSANRMIPFSACENCEIAKSLVVEYASIIGEIIKFFTAGRERKKIELSNLFVKKLINYQEGPLSKYYFKTNL